MPFKRTLKFKNYDKLKRALVAFVLAFFVIQAVCEFWSFLPDKYGPYMSFIAGCIAYTLLVGEELISRFRFVYEWVDDE